MTVELFLGTHEVSWLKKHREAPLFLSRRRLQARKSLPRAVTAWALDSGGFTELQLHGWWTLTVKEYVAEVRRYEREIGRIRFAAPQDFMCEEPVINGMVRRRNQRAKREPLIDLAEWKRWARRTVRETGHRGLMATLARAQRLGAECEVVFHGTGLSIEEHQRLTVENYLELVRIAPDVPWIPVLQGDTVASYWRHVEMYLAAGVDLRKAPLVGLGSVCRRQHTAEVERLIRALATYGIRLHGFGFKVQGLRRVWDVLVSADSLAWSFQARHSRPLPGCTHKSCANCHRYALKWWDAVCRKVERQSRQLDLWRAAA